MRIIPASRDLNLLHPKVKKLAEALIEACRKQNIPLGISETLRTVERQDYLYAQGRTRPGNIVTNARGSSMSSYHQWGLAFDVFHNKRGDEYNTSILMRVGKIGESLGLEWGGSWTRFRDMPHFQYTFGLSIADLRGGKRPPAYVEEVEDTYKKAIDILKNEGIIGTPEAWYPTPNIRFVELLISNAMPQIMRKLTYEQHIQVLEILGIISSPQLWLDKKFVEEYVKILIERIANTLVE